VERPLLPKLSYLIQKYATDDDMNGMSRMTGNQSPARQQSKQQNGSSVAEQMSQGAGDENANLVDGQS